MEDNEIQSKDKNKSIVGPYNNLFPYIVSEYINNKNEKDPEDLSDVLK